MDPIVDNVKHLHPAVPSKRCGDTALTVFLFLSFTTMSAGRGAMPVTIVQMAEEFHWDKTTIGMVLSSFYWGYTVTQIIGGWLSDKYGGLTVHWVFGMGWTIALFGISLFGATSVSIVVLLNFIFGACQGVFFPSVINILSAKVSKDKRSFVYSKMAAGGQFGSILIGFIASMFLYENGWRYVFIITGLGSGLSVVSVYILSTNIVDNINPGIEDSAKANSSITTVAKPTPWKELLREPAVLALFACHFAQGFFDKSMNWTPTFFHDQFPMMKDQAWVYNVTPRLFYSVTAFSGGWIYQKLISNGFTVTKGRKTMEFFSLFVGGSFLLLVALTIAVSSESSFIVCLMLMSLAYLARGCEVAGSTLNPTDLAPSYAGLLYGMMNTSAAIAAVVGVYIGGHILQATNNWSLVYLMVGSVCYCGISIFIAFGSGERLSLDSI